MRRRFKTLSPAHVTVPFEGLALVCLADALAVRDVAKGLVVQVAKVKEELLVLVHPHLGDAHVVNVQLPAHVDVFQLGVDAEAVKLVDRDIGDGTEREGWRGRARNGVCATGHVGKARRQPRTLR